MDNHLHVLVRLDSDVAENWSESETWRGVWPLDAVSTADRNEPAVGRADFLSQSGDRRGSLIISR